MLPEAFALRSLPLCKPWTREQCHVIVHVSVDVLKSCLHARVAPTSPRSIVGRLGLYMECGGKDDLEFGTGVCSS